jgi:hypothetical protein
MGRHVSSAQTTSDLCLSGAAANLMDIRRRASVLWRCGSIPACVGCDHGKVLVGCPGARTSGARPWRGFRAQRRDRLRWARTHAQANDHRPHARNNFGRTREPRRIDGSYPCRSYSADFRRDFLGGSVRGLAGNPKRAPSSAGVGGLDPASYSGAALPICSFTSGTLTQVPKLTTKNADGVLPTVD